MSDASSCAHPTRIASATRRACASTSPRAHRRGRARRAPRRGLRGAHRRRARRGRARPAGAAGSPAAARRAELAERRAELRRHLVQQAGGALTPFVICTVVWAASGASGRVLAGVPVDLPGAVPVPERLAPVRAGARPRPRAAGARPRTARGAGATAAATARTAASCDERERKEPTAAGELEGAVERALQGGPERHREKALEQGKLPVRERVALLLDEGSLLRGGAARQLAGGRARRRRRRDRRRARSTAARWR